MTAPEQKGREHLAVCETTYCPLLLCFATMIATICRACVGCGPDGWNFHTWLEVEQLINTVAILRRGHGVHVHPAREEHPRIYRSACGHGNGDDETAAQRRRHVKTSFEVPHSQVAASQQSEFGLPSHANHVDAVYECIGEMEKGGVLRGLCPCNITRWEECGQRHLVLSSA
jgi:hypothetical protein